VVKEELPVLPVVQENIPAALPAALPAVQEKAPSELPAALPIQEQARADPSIKRQKRKPNIGQNGPEPAPISEVVEKLPEPVPVSVSEPVSE
jgi:hypothetical protein